MIKFLLKSIIYFPLCCLAQGKSSYSIEDVFLMAGKNKGELKKAWEYFQLKGDSQKLKAMEFLLVNMPIHYSLNYYIKDSLGNEIKFNEFEYISFEEAETVLRRYKKQGARLVQRKENDVEFITGQLLIDNVELAFEKWANSKSREVSFEEFCEYILPYRVDVEPLHNWRKKYSERFSSISDSLKDSTAESLLLALSSNFKKWFRNTYDIEYKVDPLPRLGALQLLFRKKGPCEDLASLSAFVLRSLGMVATVDMVSFWATSSGKHFCNCTLDDSLRLIRFDAATADPRFTTFAREPAKVIRTTFSIQNNIANLTHQDSIPPGFMRLSNYLDVTDQFWDTDTLKCRIRGNTENKKFVFACVFNFLDWKPTWWAKVNEDAATFSNMTKGVVYLPAYYTKGKMSPAGYPVVLGYNNRKELAPSNTLRTVVIKEQEKYLMFQPGRKYRLYYWNNQWIKIGEKTAVTSTRELIFNKVPGNCLMLLVPEYSQRKERPFIIEDDGRRFWF